MEQLNVLRHQPDAIAQIGQGNVADVRPTQPDGARGRIVEPYEQAARRRLPAARAPQQPQHAAGSQVHRDVFEDQIALHVAECDPVGIDAQRPRRQPAGTIFRRGPKREEIADAADARAGALQLLDLPGDLLQRPAQQLRVMEEEVHRPQRDHALPQQVRAHPKGDRVPHGEQSGGRRPHHRPAQPRPPRLVQLVAERLVQAPHHIGHRAAGADILGARQPLFEESEQDGAGLPGFLPVGDSRLDEAAQDHERGHREDGVDDPHAPVGAEQQDEDTHQEHGVPEYPQDKLREERRQLSHVAIHALDHLAGSFGVVERQIQPQAVQGQVLADFVGRGPSHVFAGVSRTRRDQLPRDRDHEGQYRQTHQRVGCPSGPRGVDETAEDLGGHKLQRDAAEQQDAHHRHRQPLRPQVVDEKLSVLPERNRHGNSPSDAKNETGHGDPWSVRHATATGSVRPWPPAERNRVTAYRSQGARRRSAETTGKSMNTGAPPFRSTCAHDSSRNLSGGQACDGATAPVRSRFRTKICAAW